jgi:hypothetical protein
MTMEDEEFNRIEREAAMRKEAVSATMKDHIEEMRKGMSDYERGFIDGMQKQMQSSVDRAVNRMAEPAQQEPVAWMDVDENGAMSSLRYWSEPDNRHEVALYTTPPNVATPLAAQRTWVGLTSAECLQIEKDMMKYYDYQHECKTVCLPEFARAIEAKLKEKNT